MSYNINVEDSLLGKTSCTNVPSSVMDLLNEGKRGRLPRRTVSEAVEIEVNEGIHRLEPCRRDTCIPKTTKCLVPKQGKGRGSVIERKR